MIRSTKAKLWAFLCIATISSLPTLVANSAALPATLSVSSWPVGITITNPTCFNLVSGICGTTSWVSNSAEGIPLTTYTYPLTATVDGIDYELDPSSLTGCNANGANPAPGVCSVKVEVGVLAQIFASYKALPSPAIPNCLLASQNMVANHGFESTLQAGVNTGSTHYWVIGSTATSKVQHWTADSSTAQSVFPTGPVGGTPMNAAEGNKFAVLTNFGGITTAGIRAEISPAPTQGTDYVVSAKVRATAAPHPGFINFYFLNSGSLAKSANLTRIVNTNNQSWDLVGGVITANGYFNRLVIRMSGESAFGAVDDVKVCKRATDTKKIVSKPSASRSPTPKPVQTASTFVPASPAPKPVISPTPTPTNAMGPMSPS